MRLVILQMRGSVAKNYISSLIWRCYSPKRKFWTIVEQYYIVYYPIISYRSIKIYRVETMDMVISNWNNGVVGTFFISIITTVFIV